MGEDVQARYKQVASFLGELAAEADALYREAGSDIEKVTQRQRRILTRSIFAYIEAGIFSLKDIAAHRKRANDVTPADLLIAQEFSYDLKENGKIARRPLKIRTTSNLRFAFELFSRSHGISMVLDLSGEGWQKLLRSIKVRDRITHPKIAADITISDLEMMETVEAWHWFAEKYMAFMREAIRTINARSDELQAQLDSLTAKMRSRVLPHPPQQVG